MNVFAPTEMPQVQLPGTDLWVSKLGLGTVAMGRDWALKYPTPSRIPTLAEIDQLLGVARDCGINLLDTAPAYGTSEERLGQLLQDRPHDFVVCTKAGEESSAAGSQYDFTPQALRRSIERSRQRLRRNTLDLVTLHLGQADSDAVPAIETLAELKEQGLIGAIGASPKTLEGALALLPLCDVLMLQYSRQDQTMAPALELAAKNGVGVLVKKPLDSGTVRDSKTAAALSFAVQHPGVTSVLVGTTSPNHLRRNAEAVRTA